MNRDIFGRFARKSQGLLSALMRWAWQWIKYFVSLPFKWAWREFKALVWQRKLCLALLVLCAMIPVADRFKGVFTPKTMVYTAQRALAAEIPRDITLEEAKAELDAIVWGIESGGHVMEEGEIYETFDPNRAEYESCIKRGGKQPKYCLSRGPRQIKLVMLHNYWPQLHEGATLTDKEAREIAEGNESSYKFFMDCSIRIQGCVGNWMAAHVDITNPKSPIRPDVQVLINIIRKGEGVVVEE